MIIVLILLLSMTAYSARRTRSSNSRSRTQRRTKTKKKTYQSDYETRRQEKLLKREEKNLRLEQENLKLEKENLKNKRINKYKSNTLGGSQNQIQELSLDKMILSSAKASSNKYARKLSKKNRTDLNRIILEVEENYKKEQYIENISSEVMEKSIIETFKLLVSRDLEEFRSLFAGSLDYYQYSTEEY